MACVQGLVYEPGNTPWAAIDETVDWECGDTLRITFSSGPVITVTLLDRGRFAAYYVEDYGPDLPIIVDVSEYAWPFALSVLSAPASVVNVTQ